MTLKRLVISNETVLRKKAARLKAAELGAEAVDVPHLLLAIASADETPEQAALADVGLTPEVIEEKIVRMEGERERVRRFLRPNRRLEAVLTDAETLVAQHPQPVVQPRHLLIAAIESEVGLRFVGGRKAVFRLRVALGKHLKAAASGRSPLRTA